MSRLRFTSCMLLLAVSVSTSGCEIFQGRQAPQSGSITQHLMMVDAEGKNYGIVELDPINGGKMYDTQGRLIGRVIQPGAPGLAPTAQ